MLHALIERLSDYPRFFLFCRGLLEANFTIIRRTITDYLGDGRPERKVLDIACGPGAFSDLFDASSYSGVDLNAKYIAFAKDNFRGSFSVQDARKLDFPEGSFDDVLVYGLLHHLSDEDVTAVLTGMRRVLRPGGRALVIEDIPTTSRLNLVGHLLHWAENGHYIRPAADYRNLLARFFRLEEEKEFRSGVCDYYMASVVSEPATSESSPPAS